MFKRSRILVILAAVSLAIGIGLASGPSAHANTTTEMYLDHAPGWCATYDDTDFGSIVLGMCANAATQQFHLRTVSGNIFEIVSNDGFCVTYNYPNGYPDGGAMILGNCANAQTQEFYGQPNSNGGVNYWMPYRTDNNGKSVTINDKNYQLVVFNPINGSWLCTVCGSEQWSQLYT
jgi:hypothetical protein